MLATRLDHFSIADTVGGNRFFGRRAEFASESSGCELRCGRSDCVRRASSRIWRGKGAGAAGRIFERSTATAEAIECRGTTTETAAAARGWCEASCTARRTHVRYFLLFLFNCFVQLVLRLTLFNREIFRFRFWCDVLIFLSLIS